VTSWSQCSVGDKEMLERGAEECPADGVKPEGEAVRGKAVGGRIDKPGGQEVEGRHDSHRTGWTPGRLGAGLQGRIQ
jgi:hypothetical protein